MDDAFAVEPSSIGTAMVSVTDNEGAVVVVHVECKRLGLACDLPGAALEVHKQSGKKLPNLTESEIAYPTIVPTTLTLGPSHLKDHDSITLRFGEATLGLAILREQLTALGQALIALGAAETSH